MQFETVSSNAGKKEIVRWDIDNEETAFENQFYIRRKMTSLVIFRFKIHDRNVFCIFLILIAKM